MLAYLINHIDQERTMDAIAMLKQDHVKVRGLFKRIEELDEDATEECDTLFDELIASLKTHETVEEEIFYPAAKEAGEEAEEIVSHSYEEHHLADHLIEQLERADEDDETCDAKLHVLKELVEHHIEEEEGELFPLVQEGLDDERLTEVGEQMQARKAELEGGSEAADDEEEEDEEKPTRAADAKRTTTRGKATTRGKSGGKKKQTTGPAKR